MSTERCRNGHDRATAGWTHDQCRLCHRATQRRWRERHKATKSAVNRAYYLAHKEVINARSREWWRNNREKARLSLRKTYRKYRGINFWVEQVKESL